MVMRSMSDNPYAAPQSESAPTPTSSQSNDSPYGGYRELGGLSKAIVVLIGLGALLAGLQIFILHSLNLANLQPEDSPEYETEIDQWIDYSDQMSSLEVLVFFITAVLWCVWKNKSCKNAWLFRPTPARWSFGKVLVVDEPITPGLAAGSYFIPILGLWKPYQAMVFIRDQVAEKLQIGSLVGFWWTSWLVSNFASIYFTRNIKVDVYTTAEAIAYNQGLIISSGIEIVNYFLAAAVIYKLTIAQQQVAEERGLLAH